MVDLHCHILPKVDDGATSLDEALWMAKFFAADGMTHVFATPHCHRYIHLLRADILPRVVELNTQLEAAKVPLKILPGSEIQVTDSAEYRREFEAGLYCHYGDGKAFTLLEFNWSREQFPPDAVELVHWIRAQGMRPILAHPERHNYYSEDPALLKSLVDAGVWLQVTVDSLLGNHGPGPKTAAEVILQTYEDAVLATDAHNKGRCSGLSEGFAWVKERFGQKRSDDMMARAKEIWVSAKVD
jgi:protein-tyrosine phosphatase